jgi:opacity protein-like surface antigen
MNRCVSVVVLSFLAILCVGASRAHAQTPNTPAAEKKMSIQVFGGPTLGHKSAGFVSGEFDWRLTNKIDVFVEGGHMGNVATSLLDSNANIIANALGLAVGSTGIKVNHFDAGIRFNITPPSPKVNPYVLVGAGFAKATVETTFTQGGTVVDPGIPLGGDLSGSNNKTILLFGGGITFPFAKNYFADVGYRFGGILSKVSDIENDITIKTQRIMLGAGVRF